MRLEFRQVGASRMVSHVSLSGTRRTDPPALAILSIGRDADQVRRDIDALVVEKAQAEAGVRAALLTRRSTGDARAELARIDVEIAAKASLAIALDADVQWVRNQVATEAGGAIAAAAQADIDRLLAPFNPSNLMSTTNDQPQ